MNEKEKIDLIIECPFCGKETIVSVYYGDYLKWRKGALVQDAFPYLSANDREALISGICPDCWNNTFKEIGKEYY